MCVTSNAKGILVHDTIILQSTKQCCPHSNAAHERVHFLWKQYVHFECVICEVVSLFALTSTTLSKRQYMTHRQYLLSGQHSWNSKYLLIGQQSWNFLLEYGSSYVFTWSSYFFHLNQIRINGNWCNKIVEVVLEVYSIRV